MRNRSSYRDFLDLSDPAIRSKLRPAIIAVLSVLLFISAAGVFLTLPLGRSGHVDFRTFYTVGYMVRTGHGPEIHDPAKYQEFQNRLVGPMEGLLPFNHLAYEGLLYVPFSYFRYQTAYFLFIGTNLLVLAGIVKMFRRMTSPLEEVWSLLPAALVVCFLPVAVSLIEGQDSLLLLVLFVAATQAMHRRNDFKAGILLGLSLFKFQYALPVALLFLIWKRWSFLRGFAVSLAIAIGLSLWLTGISGATSYAHSLLEVSAKYSVERGALYGIHPDGMPNLRGLAYMVTGGSTSATHLIALISSAIVMIWGARRRPSLPGALLASLLVSYHQVIADTSLLVLPIGIMLASSVTEGRTWKSDFAAKCACVAFMGPTALLFAGTRFYLLALPVMALFALWDAKMPSPKDFANSERCQQTDTKLSLDAAGGRR